VLATLRRDGSPRVSGSEVDFRGDDLFIGSMPDARKAQDLQRDNRFALHGAPGDMAATGGDVKLAGRAEEITDPGTRSTHFDGKPVEASSHLFRLDLTEAVVTNVEDEKYLVVRLWRPGQGVRRFQRT
jgi:hypothetical protein